MPYVTLTSARTTEPDMPSLLSQARALDATAGVAHDRGTAIYLLKKATTWTAPQITQAQNVIDTAPASSPQLSAQAEWDALKISALMGAFLAVLDEVNVLRTELNTLRSKVTPPLTPPLPMRTEAQFKTAARNRVGTL